MARKVNPLNTTRMQIVQVATQYFLEIGVSNTTQKLISDELGLSTGNVTYYFPSKEHILSVLVEMLCDFQWEMMKKETNEGLTALLAICLELTTMAAMCEESEIAKDLYLTVYTHPMTLEIIRKNDAEKAKTVFAEYTANWSENEYLEAETLISGIEYATLMTTESSAPLETRIAGALKVLMTVYNVPEEIRNAKIEKVLAMDYRALSRRVLKEFIQYVEEVNDKAVDTLLLSLKRKHTLKN